jgi:tetratricopeptide (TPR) repeat protein
LLAFNEEFSQMLLQRLASTRLWIIIVVILFFSPALWFAGCKNFVMLHQLKAGLHEREPLAIEKISWLSVNMIHDASVVATTGWAYQKLGDFTLAQKYLERAVQLQPKDTRVWFLLGNMRLEAENEAGAIAAFKAAGAGRWLSWQGLQAHAQNDWPKAIRFFLLATKVEPTIAVYYRYLGDAYVYAGQQDAAASAYRQAAELDPDAYQSALLEGLAAFTISDWDMSLSSYKHAQLLKPDQSEPYYRQGLIWYWNKNNYEKGITLSEKAVELNPRDPNIYISLIQICTSEKIYTCADDWFQRGDEAIPDNIGLIYQIALSQFQRGDYQQTILLVDRIVNLEGSYHLAWDLKGLALLNVGRGSQAIEALEQSLVFSPGNPVYRVHLAQALLEVGQDCRALEEAEQADLVGHDINEVAVLAEMIREKVKLSCKP